MAILSRFVYITDDIDNCLGCVNFDQIDSNFDGEGDFCENLDGDGWTKCQGDCRPHDINGNPNATEICNDKIDNDCDGKKDCDDVDCNGSSNCQSLCAMSYANPEDRTVVLNYFITILLPWLTVILIRKFGKKV